MILPIANQFVAGETIDRAISHSKEINRNGANVILNLLGEHYSEPGGAIQDTQSYLTQEIQRRKRSCVHFSQVFASRHKYWTTNIQG